MVEDCDVDAPERPRRVDGHEIDTSCWPTSDVGALDETARGQYLARREGVILYLSGASDASILKRSGVGKKQIYRLIRERCLQTHPDGQVYGWRALIPHVRINPYRRRSKLRVDKWGLGAAGAMQALLEREVELAKAFKKRILRSCAGKNLTEIKLKPRQHASWLVAELRKRGYELRGEWPFNTKSNGYWAIYRYCKALLAANPRAAAGVIGGPDLQKKLRSGDGVDRPVNEVFQRVEMDAHKLDGRFCVMMPQMAGGWAPKIIHRLWVIVILEVVSRAVLGYYLSLRREVSKEDVLRAIKCALTKWNRRQLYFSDEAYIEDASLPSGVHDNWIGLCWNETSVDGALAETCKTVRVALRDVVGSDLLEPNNSFAVRRSKDDRPFIETYFRTLASRGFQRLSNTTGAKPQDKQGRNPDEVALTSQFQYEYAEELLDVLIANYNAKRHNTLGDRSPLEFLEFVLTRPDAYVRRADANLTQQIVSYRKKCLVKGGAAEGRAPYVNFVHGRYTNDILSNRHDLVGREVWVVNHLELDARLAQCITLDGQSLGILRAAPPWHKLPHSLDIRRSICALASRGKFSFAGGADGVKTFMDFVENQPDKKLPIHPAYLEARRILVAAAEDVVGTDMVSIAKGRGGSGEQSERSANVPGKPKVAAKALDQRGNTRKLPARRMTATG